MSKTKLEQLKEQKATLKVLSEKNYKDLNADNFDNAVNEEFKKQKKEYLFYNMISIGFGLFIGLLFIGLTIPLLVNDNVSFVAKATVITLSILVGLIIARLIIAHLFVSTWYVPAPKIQICREEEIRIRYTKYLTNLVLKEEEIKPLYQTLNQCYSEEDLLSKIKEINKPREEIGSYGLLERLYDHAIKDESEKENKKVTGNQNAKNIQKQIDALLQK